MLAVYCVGGLCFLSSFLVVMSFSFLFSVIYFSSPCSCTYTFFSFLFVLPSVVFFHLLCIRSFYYVPVVNCFFGHSWWVYTSLVLRCRLV